MSYSLNDIGATKARSIDMNNLPELTLDNIFDVIWDADINRLSVSDKNSKGQWRDPNADILLDKQGRAKGAADSLEDSAPNPLFHTVRDSALQKRTFRAFLDLFDNYDAVVNNIEYLNGGELDEIDEFLEAILETPCMTICHKYITEVLGHTEFATRRAFKHKLFDMWFELHTLSVDEVLTPEELEIEREKLRESGVPQSEQIPTTRKKVIVKYCSGFEHVFVGEISMAEDGKIGNILGGHNWYSYYLNEVANVVDFLGLKYSKQSLAKIGAPFVCIKFRWDQDGNTYIKDRGSFFIGNSPEFSMAIATCCFFETITTERAIENGWDNRIPTKFKSRRQVGGYYYDYYICRQKQYLVSCFQELLGMTEETEKHLKMLQRRRNEEESKLKLAAKQEAMQKKTQDLGIVMPDGTTLSQKAYNRLKRRLQAKADEEGVTVEDLIARGDYDVPFNPSPATDAPAVSTDAPAKEGMVGFTDGSVGPKTDEAVVKVDESVEETKTVDVDDVKPVGIFSSIKVDNVVDNTCTEQDDFQPVSLNLGEVDIETESTTDTPLLVPEVESLDALSLITPSIRPQSEAVSISPCFKPIKPRWCHLDFPKPAIVSKPVYSKQTDFQHFAKEYILRNKILDDSKSDAELYRNAKIEWVNLGFTVCKHMGIPHIKNKRECFTPIPTISTPVDVE